MNEQPPPVIVTGCSGFIGEALTERLARRYPVVGFDRKAPARCPAGMTFVPFDVTSDASVQAALDRVRSDHGGRLASVVHLAAYFDLTGEPNPKYDEVTVRGTERLIRRLQGFQVEQFLFASSMLVHVPARPGEAIDETRPVDPKFPYRASKIAAEAVLRDQHADIPLLVLRPAGVYDDRCRNPFLAHQIAWIHEQRLEGHLYPGNPNVGQAYVHRDDLAEAVLAAVKRRAQLPPETAILIGEPDAMSVAELHDAIGRLIHGDDWATWRVPKAAAQVGTAVERRVGLGDPFIRPWMIASADDHYALDISRARSLLGWEPRHRLRITLPRMIQALKADPTGWYRANKLDRGPDKGPDRTGR